MSGHGSRSSAIARSLIGLAAMVVLSVVFFARFGRIERNSDNASAMLEGMDLVGGNWLLKGWVLPPNNFVTSDLLLAGVLTKMVGPTPDVMYYLPALLWASVVVLGLVLATEGRRGREVAVACALSGTMLALPIFRGNPQMQIISQAPMHIGAIGYMLACFLILSRAERGDPQRHDRLVVLYGFLSLIAVFGDPMHIVVAALPIGVVSLVFVLVGTEHGRLHYRIIGVTIATVIVAKALLALVYRIGFSSPNLWLPVVQIENLGRTFGLLWQAALIFVGSLTDFNESASAITVKLLRSAFIPLLLIALGLVGYRVLTSLWARWKTGDRQGLPDYLDALLAAATAVNIAAFCASGMIVDTGSTRYVLPGFVFGSILLSRVFARSKLVGSYAGLALASSLAFVAIFEAFTVRPGVAPSEQIRLTRWLEENRLLDGFAQFWDCNIITTLSSGRISVRALTDGKGANPYLWHSNRNWYQPDSFRSDTVFVLVRDGAPPEQQIDLEALIPLFGEPIQSDIVGVYEVRRYKVSPEGFSKMWALASK